MSIYQATFKAEFRKALMKERFFNKHGYGLNSPVKGIAALLFVALKRFQIPEESDGYNVICSCICNNGTDGKGQILPALVYGNTELSDVAEISTWLEGGFGEQQQKNFDYLTKWISLYSQLLDVCLMVNGLLLPGIEQANMSIRPLMADLLVLAKGGSSYRYVHYITELLAYEYPDDKTVIPGEILTQQKELMERVEVHLKSLRQRTKANRPT